jgi:hypothetical protein
MKMDSIEERKLDKMVADLCALENRAKSNHVAIIQVSKRRYVVASTLATQGGYWSGSVVHGPDTRERCEIYVNDYIRSVDVVRAAAKLPAEQSHEP